MRLGIAGYVGVIVLIAVALAQPGLLDTGNPHMGLTLLLFLAAFIPATEVATAFVNRAVTWIFGAARLPGLELKAGVPSSLRTLVVVPSLLASEADLLDRSSNSRFITFPARPAISPSRCCSMASMPMRKQSTGEEAAHRRGDRPSNG